MPYGKQGATTSNKSTISNKAIDPPHTMAHEIGHQFLRYNQSENPENKDQHFEAGGIFIYKETDESGNVTTPTQGANQGNVNSILKSLPKAKNKEN